MTGSGRARLALWSVAAVGVAATALALAAPLVPGVAPSAAAPRAAAPAARGRYAADSLAALVVSRDPFRLGRRPAAVAFDPARGERPAGEGYVPPKPALRLVGLVEGARPQAIIDGLPGVEGGRALRVGESAGPFRVSGIRDGQVRVSGMDTVWVLTLRRP